MEIAGGSSIDFQIDTESELLSDAVAEHGIHGYWWYSQTPGIPLPDQDYIDDFKSIFPPETTGANEVDIANLTVALETADAWGVELSDQQNEELIQFVNRAAGTTDKPFLLCRSARSLELLGEEANPIAKTWETNFEPTDVTSPHELMDVYGSLCLYEYQGNLNPGAQSDAREALEPLLENPDQFQDFDAYYLASSWELADGDTSLLAPLSEAVEERISPETGMVREATTVLGTLQATYMVGWLAYSVNAEDEVYDSDTVSATRRLVIEARQRGENFEELYGGLILRQAGEPDPDLEASAVDWALGHLDSLTLGKDNIRAVHELIFLVEQLDSSARIPDLPVSLFEVGDREDRLHAWQLLSLRHHVEAEDELLEHFADLIESTPAILEEEQDSLSMVEVDAAVPVASMEAGINDILSLLSPWGGATARLRGVRRALPALGQRFRVRPRIHCARHQDGAPMTSDHLYGTPTSHGNAPPVLDLVRVRKGYSGTPVIQEATIHSPGSETVTFQGPSGSGKSTLLNVVGLLTSPDAGTVAIKGTSTRELGEEGRARIRQREIGFVFQDSHLLPALTTLENVMLPSTAPPSDTVRRARGLLNDVGLSHRTDSSVRYLSGGEAKRAAIARALINAPSLILADEPTAGLDLESSLAVLDLLDSQRSSGAAVLIASHDPVVSTRSTRVVKLVGGCLASEPVDRGERDD